MNTRILFALLVISLLTGCQERSEPMEPTDSIPLRYNFSNEIEEELRTSDKPWKDQVAAWDYSYIGAYQKMLESWDTDRSPREILSDSAFQVFSQTYRQQNAVSEILERADTSQIVIINEAHHQPLHRVFTTQLLADLYERGYRYFGLETLNKGDEELNTRKYPIYLTGTYSVEPQFGDLIREALRLGFELFAYESDGNGPDREIGQARNIEVKINGDPEGKYLIHCGFAHAIKSDYPAWGKTMAGRLKEYTGINPLTIDQTAFTERSRPDFGHPLYQRLELSESVVYLDASGHSIPDSNYPKGYDLLVFHPQTRMESGRPHWLFRNGKQPVRIDLKELDITLPVMVLAFPSEEDPEVAVPVDVIEVKDPRDEVFLALKKGRYRIIIQNAELTARQLFIDV